MPFISYVGFGHGSNVDKRHVLKKPVTFKAGNNNISMLAMTVGLPVSKSDVDFPFLLLLWFRGFDLCKTQY